MILISLGCAWITGIILGLFVNVSPVLLLTGLLPVTGAFFFGHHRKVFILSGLCLIALFSGAWYQHTNLPETNPDKLNFYNDTGEIEIQGMISRQPELKAQSIQLHVEASKILVDGTWQDISGTALVFVPLYTDYAYGDMMRITGTPRTPLQLDDFDYERYLAIKGIYSTFTFPKIDVLEREQGSKLLQWIYSFRNRLSEVIGKTVSEPQASFTRSVLLGLRSSLHESVKDEFHTTGTSHLLAISGLHLSIIAGLFIAFGRRLFGRKGYWYVWLALLSVWFYAILSGLNPPVVRASIMVSVYLASELFGRQNSGIISLIVAAAIMTGVTPNIIRDAAFQMSFAAMAGLILIFPSLRMLFRNMIREHLGENGLRVTFACILTDSLSISLGAVLAVWPLIAYYFNTVSPISPIVTLLALPFLPFVIISGALAGLAGLVFLPFAQIIGWVTWFFASCILDIVHVFSFIPSVELTNFPILAAGIYYLVLLTVIRYIPKKYRNIEPERMIIRIIPFIRKEWLITGLSMLAGCLVIIACSFPGTRLQISFLDVGQGESILIQKGSRQVLIDGGPDYNAVTYGLGRIMPFWDRTIDLVVLTHPDADHLTGLMEVLNRYQVKQVAYPDLPADSELYRNFQRLLAIKRIPAATINTGEKIAFGDVTTLEVLNPSENSKFADIDNNSLVLRMITGDFCFLFTGDILSEAELNLVAKRSVSICTVLKVAHHGSASSSTEEFLNVVKPSVAVISVGTDNRFGHPSDEVIQRLGATGISCIYRTDTQGTITFITDGTSLKVQAERRNTPEFDIDITPSTQ